MAGPLSVRNRSRRLAVVLAANMALVAGESAAGWLGHSTALLADAGHNLTDVAAVAAGLSALRWSTRPRSDQRSYGNHRATTLAALFNASVLALVTLSVIAVCTDRLLRPSVPQAGVLTSVAGLALVVNGAAALILFERVVPDLNVRATAVHMGADACSAGVALVAGLAVLVGGPGAALADPAAGLAVAVLIAIQAARLLRASVDVLLEGTPPDVDLDRLRAVITGEAGVGEVHDLHVWSLSSDLRALSAHLVLTGHPTLEEAQVVAERVRTTIAQRFGLQHSTLELECERCSQIDDPCQVSNLEHRLAAGGRTRRSPE